MLRSVLSKSVVPAAHLQPVEFLPIVTIAAKCCVATIITAMVAVQILPAADVLWRCGSAKNSPRVCCLLLANCNLQHCHLRWREQKLTYISPLPSCWRQSVPSWLSSGRYKNHFLEIMILKFPKKPKIFS